MASSDALGFEKKLWEAAEKLRSNMDAAVYKHVVLGLIFLKYISDAFDELYKTLKADDEADEEDEDEYIAQKVFWVPKAARWGKLRDNARQPEIGQIIDDAMRAIEKRNTPLKGVLPKNYARPDLDKVKLGELVDLIGSIGLGSKENQSKDIIGRVYEYFLGEFASAEGKKGGQFYTPRSVVRLLVEIIRPFNGRIYDPCCGSGGMFVQSDLFLKEHGGRIDDLSIYGQESNPTTWRLFKMNLALRRIAANIGPEAADTFSRDLHPTLRADYILANPPFNQKEWGQPNLIEDARWAYGVPPQKNANYAWLQHILHHLKPNGKAAVILSNSSMSISKIGQGELRKKIIESNVVDGMILLPPKLFHNTPVSACIWLLNKGREENRKDVLLIDARKFGRKISKKQIELSEEEIKEIASIYSDYENNSFEDIEFVAKVVTTTEILSRKKTELSPQLYVGHESSRAAIQTLEDIQEHVTTSLNTNNDDIISTSKSLSALLSQLSENPGELQQRRLDQVADIIMGQSPPGDTYNNEGDGLPFYQGAKDFGIENPTPAVWCTKPKKTAIENDILFSVRAPIGMVNIANNKCATGRGIAIIRPKKQEDWGYIRLCIEAMGDEMQIFENTGSVVSNVTKDDLSSHLVPWPDTERRGKIASISQNVSQLLVHGVSLSSLMRELRTSLTSALMYDSEEGDD